MSSGAPFQTRSFAGVSCTSRQAHFLKGCLTQDFCQVFFHKSLPLGPLSIPWGPFRIFTKIYRDFRKYRLITGVNNNDEKCKNFEIGSFSIFLYIYIWVVVYTHIMIFYLMFIVRCREADFVASVSSPVFMFSHTSSTSIPFIFSSNLQTIVFCIHRCKVIKDITYKTNVHSQAAMHPTYIILHTHI
jgi:hypothetical protein